jgi:hypothetical protein
MKNTEIEGKIKEFAGEPITITTELEDPGIVDYTTASMQWVSSITTYHYDEKGNISSSITTTFDVPDEPLYKVLQPLMAVDPEDVCCACCEACEDDEEEAEDDEDANEENECYRLSPKGIAMMAALDCGFVKSIEDEKFELFWSLFHSRMVADGYAEEGDL